MTWLQSLTFPDALDGDADSEDDDTGEYLDHEDHDEELEGGNDDGDDVSLQLFSGPDPWAPDGA